MPGGITLKQSTDFRCLAEQRCPVEANGPPMVLLTLTAPELDGSWSFSGATVHEPASAPRHSFPSGARSAQEPPLSLCPLPESVYAKRGPRHVRPAPPSNESLNYARATRARRAVKPIVTHASAAASANAAANALSL